MCALACVRIVRFSAQSGYPKPQRSVTMPEDVSLELPKMGCLCGYCIRSHSIQPQFCEAKAGPFDCHVQGVSLHVLVPGWFPYNVSSSSRYLTLVSRTEPFRVEHRTAYSLLMVEQCPLWVISGHTDKSITTVVNTPGSRADRKTHVSGLGH